MDLQLPKQSVPIITNVVSSNPKLDIYVFFIRNIQFVEEHLIYKKFGLHNIQNINDLLNAIFSNNKKATGIIM
jgi:hypothetical protein